MQSEHCLNAPKTGEWTVTFSERKMKLGLKLLAGWLLAAAVMAVAPASATTYVTGTSGSVWVNVGSDSAATVPSGTPFTTFTPGPLDYNSNVTNDTLGGFTNGAVGGSAASYNMASGTGNNFYQITGAVTLGAGANGFNLEHDDGAVFYITGLTGPQTGGSWFYDPGPTAAVLSPFVVNAPSAGTYNYTLDYVECCGPPAVLQFSYYPAAVTPGPIPGEGFSGLAMLALAGAYAWARKFA